MGCEAFGAVRVASSEGGGAGGAGVEDCCCSSSRAAAEDEKNRRGVPLVLDMWRTHLIHVLNWRADGTADAIAVGRGVASPGRRWSALRIENVKTGLGAHQLHHHREVRKLQHHHVRHGFHKDISADAGRHTSIESLVNTARCAHKPLQCAPPHSQLVHAMLNFAEMFNDTIRTLNYDHRLCTRLPVVHNNVRILLRPHQTLRRTDCPRDHPPVSLTRTPPLRILSSNTSPPPHAKRHPTSRSHL